MDIPTNFTFDPKSGLYYNESISTDPDTNLSIRLLTWLDPETGFTSNITYPVEPQIETVSEDVDKVLSLLQLPNDLAIDAQLPYQPQSSQPLKQVTYKPIDVITTPVSLKKKLNLPIVFGFILLLTFFIGGFFTWKLSLFITKKDMSEIGKKETRQTIHFTAKFEENDKCDLYLMHETNTFILNFSNNDILSTTYHGEFKKLENNQLELIAKNPDDTFDGKALFNIELDGSLSFLFPIKLYRIKEGDKMVPVQKVEDNSNYMEELNATKNMEDFPYVGSYYWGNPKKIADHVSTIHFFSDATFILLIHNEKGVALAKIGYYLWNADENLLNVYYSDGTYNYHNEVVIINEDKLRYIDNRYLNIGYDVNFLVFERIKN